MFPSPKSHSQVLITAAPPTVDVSVKATDKGGAPALGVRVNPAVTESTTGPPDTSSAPMVVLFIGGVTPFVVLPFDAAINSGLPACGR